MLGVLAATVLALGVAAAQQPFQILTTYLPRPQQGKSYKAQLRGIGGTPPYTWRVAQGKLPDGLTLDSQSGQISGLPRSGTPFSVLVAVNDSSNPPMEETRLLRSGASAPLAMQWSTAPSVDGQNLDGAVAVRNDSGQTVQLTVIVVAVAKSDHKAFSLRYAHQELKDNQSTGALPFSVFLPPNTYTVHVDAVAEVSAKTIYRQRLEVTGMQVPGS